MHAYTQYSYTWAGTYNTRVFMRKHSNSKTTSQDGRNYDRVFDSSGSTGKRAIRVTLTAKSLKGCGRNDAPSTKAGRHAIVQYVVDRPGRCRENFRKFVHTSRTGLRSEGAFIYSIRVLFS